ncbi:IS1182 family transposase [Thermodesulfobacteriota bacterium]
MAKFKAYDYSQLVFLPVCLEDQLIPGTLEFAIHTLVETQMDMSVFEDKYNNDETGRAAYDPKVLLKVVLLAYSRGITTSRKIEQACRENITFMALACGQKPDHSTIAAFVSTMKEQVLPLFRDVLLVCDQEGLLGGTMFALDGCKLKGNASRQWSGRVEDFERKKNKIENKVRQMLDEQGEVDKREGSGSDGILGRDKSKQIERLKKQAARIGKWLRENEPKIGATGKEIKSNITDNESASMATDTSGALQGYNGQALVDSKHQIIVHGDASGKGSDGSHVPPMIDGAKENLQQIGHPEDYFAGKILTADSDYHSHENLAKCIEEDLDAYIPDKRFRTRDPRFRIKKRSMKNRKRFMLDDFIYDKVQDYYKCPQGNILKLNAKNTITTGVIYNRYVADEKDCSVCTMRHKCLTAKGGKRRYLMVPVGSTEDNLSKKMQAKIDSEQGRRIYPLRMAIVEPVFANIRTQKRLDHFTLRSRAKVRIQWLLYCLVHNIEKILHYGEVYA